jgi:hypothetical protein
MAQTALKPSYNDFDLTDHFDFEELDRVSIADFVKHSQGEVEDALYYHRNLLEDAPKAIFEENAGFGIIFAIPGLADGESYALTIDAGDVISKTGLTVEWGGETIAAFALQTEDTFRALKITAGSGNGQNLLRFVAERPDVSLDHCAVVTASPPAASRSQAKKQKRQNPGAEEAE